MLIPEKGVLVTC